MTRKFLLDVAERAVATYAQCFVGLLLVSGATNLDAISTALVAAIPAALSVVKSALASHYGEKGTAALLP